MKELVLLMGGVYGSLAIVLGAFGAHGLKKHLTVEQLKSFETGVKYQVYHALLLVICGNSFSFLTLSQQVMGWMLILGVFFFSFSIYGLVGLKATGRSAGFLGPITPLGGILLVLGWVLLTVEMVRLSGYL